MPAAPLAVFFVLAFALTWACWIPAALMAGGATDQAGKWLLWGGSLGPLLATLVVLSRPGQRAARARWWRRLKNVSGLASPAGTLCILLPVLVAELSLDTYTITGGIDLPPLRLPQALAVVLPTLMFGPLSGEPAWRGYALPTLILRRDPLGPTLFLAALWGTWHLPLFYIQGTYQAGIALASVPGLLFFVNIASQSLLMTSFYLATRCTWAAVLFHWLTNLLGEIWQLPIAAEVHRTLWMLLIATALVMIRPPFGLRGYVREDQ